MITHRPMQDMIVEICASCQVGGHHLAQSVGVLGVLAAVALGRKITKKSDRDEFIVNVFEDYLLAGKPIYKKEYARFAIIVKGGLPKGYKFKEIMQMVKSHQRPKQIGAGKRLTLLPRDNLPPPPDGTDPLRMVQLVRYGCDHVHKPQE